MYIYNQFVLKYGTYLFVKFKVEQTIVKNKGSLFFKYDNFFIDTVPVRKRHLHFRRRRRMCKTISI